MRIKLGLVATALFVAACGSESSQPAGESTQAPTLPDPGSNNDPGGQNGGPGGNGGNQGGDQGGDTQKPPENLAPLATGISVTEVAVFQGVKVSVEKNNAKVTTRAAQVVSSRDALVRVYVTPGTGFASKSLTGELRISNNGTEQVFKDTKSISRASTDDTLTTTFNFEVPGSAISVGAKYAVAVTDPSLGGQRGTEVSTARYPGDGSLEALDAKSTGKQLRVQLVPVQYNADGSGRLPDTSPATLDLYKKGFFKMYPVADVEITVHAPWPTSQTISANGSGFSQVLQSMVSLRSQDRAPADVYYMGIFAPRASFSQYCSGGCVTGLSGMISNPNDSAGRASVGIGFGGEDSVLTAVHEVGHAHGRQHSPCGGAAGPDPGFPYQGGGIGVWGYDLVAKKLINPSQGKDMMGYCQPEWISDYTYNKLFLRVASVNGNPTAMRVTSEPRSYRMVSIEPDGSLRWGESILLEHPPMNEPRTVRWLAADGSTIDSATGYFYGYEDLPGGFMIVPEQPRAFERLQVFGLPASVKSELARIQR